MSKQLMQMVNKQISKEVLSHKINTGVAGLKKSIEESAKKC